MSETNDNGQPDAPDAAEQVAEVVQLKGAAEALENRIDPSREQREPEPIPQSVPAQDPELDEVEPANIAQAEAAEEVEPFDKLQNRARRLTPERVRTILESLLFVSDKPLPDEAIRQCTGLDVEVIRKGMEKLQGHYREGVRGIVLTEVAGGWQLRTDPGSSEFVRRFLKVKPQRLTRAALETLAIIAYRQPVTRPEIEEIRACDCGAVIKALLDRRLIKIIGKKEEVGRPMLYGTTREFLEFFNLKDLASLPTLREFHELSEEHQEIVERETRPKPTTKGMVAELRDTQFEERLNASNAEAEGALDDLEKAIGTADTATKEVEQTLNPPAPPTDGQPPTEE